MQTRRVIPQNTVARFLSNWLQFSRILKTRDRVMEGDVINENNSSTTPSSILLKWELMSLLVGGAAAHKWLRWSFTVCVSHLTAKPPTFTK